MYKAPDSFTPDLPPLASTISLPYQLTPGRATGTFLAGLARKMIVGTRCSDCGRVEAPAGDTCACGSADLELVQLGTQGELRGFTRTPAYTLALVRIDGTDCDFLHRLDGDADWQVGMRVEARWAAEAKGGVLDLAGFAPTGARVEAAPKPLAENIAPVEVVPTSLQLNYQHAQGPYYGRLFDEMNTAGRILGIRCTRCHGVLLPPREICDACYAPTGTWTDVKDSGVLQAFSIIHLKFVGQTREPPYVYAEIILDGASTKIIHVLDGVDIPNAPKNLKPGMRVKAVWKGERKGSLDDISHFILEQPAS
jgi:uncharacterized OB-fold protein